MKFKQGDIVYFYLFGANVTPEQTVPYKGVVWQDNGSIEIRFRCSRDNQSRWVSKNLVYKTKVSALHGRAAEFEAISNYYLNEARKLRDRARRITDKLTGVT